MIILQKTQKCFIFLMVSLLTVFHTSAQNTLKTSKKMYAKADTVVFYYHYTGKWESVWLDVKPVNGKGNAMTTAADLYGNPTTRKFAGRFGKGRYKAQLVGNSGNGTIKKDLASCMFEVRD